MYVLSSVAGSRIKNLELRFTSNLLDCLRKEESLRKWNKVWDMRTGYQLRDHQSDTDKRYICNSINV